MAIESIYMWLASFKQIESTGSDKRLFNYAITKSIKNINDDSSISPEYITHPTTLAVTTIEKSRELINSFAQIDNREFHEAPNDRSIKTSLDLLTTFNHLDISPIINPTVDGGIMFEFYVDEQYFFVEIFNEGEIVFLERQESFDNVNEFTISQVKKRIEFIHDEKLQMC